MKDGVHLMKVFLYIFLVTQVLPIPMYLYHLSTARYPRQRSAMSALEDGIAMSMCVGFAIWTIYLLRGL